MTGTSFRLGETLCWLVIAVYATASILPSFFPTALPLGARLGLVVFLPLLFALLHGALRFGPAGIVAFLVLCLGISNLLENVGVLTGFPFGRYSYSDVMGPKLFNVPLLIGPAYFGAGYTSWVLAEILLRETDRVPDRLAIFAVPLVAAFIMVGWDVCFDPGSSTHDHLWIWQKGGGYFGVPLTNYLGWYFTVLAFLLAFAVYRACRGRAESSLSAGYWAQPPVLFIVMALAYPADYLAALMAGRDEPIADATGHIWSTLDLRETAAIVSLYTMVFVGVTCLLVLARRTAR